MRSMSRNRSKSINDRDRRRTERENLMKGEVFKKTAINNTQVVQDVNVKTAKE